MPKEVIHGEDFDVVVGWTPDCDMQIAVQTVGQYSILSALYGRQEDLEGLGDRLLKSFPGLVAPGCSTSSSNLAREVLDVIEGSKGSDPNEAHWSYTGLWATMRRGQVNGLIRQLRRARDSAFGKDE